jgi:hypothetical protein
MNAQRKKVVFFIIEIITLAILSAGGYWGMVKLFIGSPIIVGGITITWDWVFSRTSLVTVLILDIIWIASIKFLPIRNVHAKIILTFFLLALSGAIVTCNMMPSSFGF